MSSKHIEDLPPAGPLTGAEPVHVVQPAGSRQTTTADIAALASGLAATTELIRDTIAAALVAGNAIAVTVNDAGDTITIAADNEVLQDMIAAFFTAGTGVNSGIVLTYNDAGNLESIGLASSAFQTLTDAATIAWDMSLGFNAKVTLTASGHTFGTPTNPVEGRTYSLMVIQDGTGSRTVNWPASISFGAAGVPTLSTAAGKKDLFSLQCLDAAAPEFRASLNKSA